MRTALNVQGVNAAMKRAGLSRSAMAADLALPKEAVSAWLKNSVFPRPAHLLKLAKLLKLSYDELVAKEEEDAPVVAFRRVPAAKTQAHHLERARDMGRLLRQLAPYLPVHAPAELPVLESPSTDYGYLQRAAAELRQAVDVTPEATLDFEHLIESFACMQAIVIPVLWGGRKQHGNALHIHLPDSRTTWVYLNLDVNIHDFKFWMAHELGHCLSPSLRDEAAEDFADAFAGALLFPQAKAEAAYGSLKQCRTENAWFSRIFHMANKEVISPYTILMEANRHAKAVNEPELEVTSAFYKRLTRFNKQHRNLSSSLLDEDEAEPQQFVKKTAAAFGAPFFDAMKKHLRKSGQGYGHVQTVMDIPLLDAKGIYAELV